MEIAFIISTFLLIAYALLALFDGVFLHLYKYRLQERQESKLEHFTHTIRAFLFFGILYSLFIRIEDNQLFYIGLFLVVLDIITLLVDAYSEQDSRKFMGGLPRWEYILHLVVNGFHFASLAVFFVIKINLTDNTLILQNSFQQFANFHIFKFVALNLLPGSILIALLHIFVLIPKFNFYLKKLQPKCC